ncbi:hypothetical protein K402DRAFT_389816 [Aulographum hederae CBS 113979]|uniref:Cupredoxin n=1 Tax=Aulographum hederae CBS 113979 TaxID=1176131 RepID=A0A6G1HCN3_9PEZI|nr:hypothetical protein K402DRAFT_389816 [Aulographum hederae CBS 113979]
MVLFSRTAFVALSCAAQLFTSVIAQDGPESSPTSSAESSAQTHVVKVGEADHKMEPDVTLASEGDIIEFHFFPPNHSVVRAEYMHPCVPYEKFGPRAGFFSGFMPVDAVLDDPPKYQVRVNNTDPIFFYCSAPGSCINYAMVGVINPNATTSLEQHKQAARDSAYMLQPGEAFPAEADPSSANPSATATSAGSAASSTSSGAPAPTGSGSSDAQEGSSHHGLSTGAIAGIAIGGAAVLLLAAAVFFMMGRNKSLKDTLHRQSHMPGPAGPEVMGNDGTVYVPVRTSNFRNSGMTMPYEVPPRYKSPELQVEEFSPTGGAQGGAFTEFGGVHNSPTSPRRYAFR